MVHVPRLTRQLQQLLAGQRVAALGTIAGAARSIAAAEVRPALQAPAG